MHDGCKTGVVLGTVWGWVTAAIGAIMMALLIAYGTASGTWVDEHSSLLVDKAGHSVDMPSVAAPLLVGALALVLLIGGLVVGMIGTTARATRRRPAASIAE